MSDLENPYQSPQAPVVPEAPQDTGVSFSAKMLNYLYEASPWLRFIGVLGFIGCGLIVVIGIVLAAVGSFAFSELTELSGLEEEFGNFFAWMFAGIYIPMGVLFFFPSYFTYNFGKKIKSFRFSNSPEDLELAFKNNKSLWKFYGIISIIYLSFIPFVLVVAIIGGVAALFSVL